MVFVVYSTTGELIKLLPLLTELKNTGECYAIVLSQQEEQLKRFFDAYPEAPKPDLWLVHGYRYQDLSKQYQIPVWFYKSIRDVIRNRSEISSRRNKDNSKNILIVHGDTMTTVFGAVWARLLGLKVGHVEAGMRSFKLFSPFPEEIDRRIVGKLARVHFAPGKGPFRNLSKAKGDVLNIGNNTIYDSILLARNMKPATTIPELPARYGIVSIHRNELLANKKVFTQTLKTLAEYSRKSPLVFLQHPVTIARAKDLGLEHLLSENMIYAPKLDYFSFINLLDGAAYAVTDSGGLQEECTYLAKPCLVHRTVTEWEEGLESGIVKLSYFKDEILREFLDDPSRLESKKLVPISSPTGMIIDYLHKHQFID